MILNTFDNVSGGSGINVITTTRSSRITLDTKCFAFMVTNLGSTCIISPLYVIDTINSQNYYTSMSIIGIICNYQPGDSVNNADDLHEYLGYYEKSTNRVNLENSYYYLTQFIKS